mmetsp:Transcript_1245/g.2745  ORF Transcript_1245/g.2745 Transcript_1245/m.2745 type:complete len:510 (-) Transcript_1245:113-1642(-)
MDMDEPRHTFKEESAHTASTASTASQGDAGMGAMDLRGWAAALLEQPERPSLDGNLSDEEEELNEDRAARRLQNGYRTYQAKRAAGGMSLRHPSTFTLKEWRDIATEAALAAGKPTTSDPVATATHMEESEREHEDDEDEEEEEEEEEEHRHHQHRYHYRDEDNSNRAASSSLEAENQEAAAAAAAAAPTTTTTTTAAAAAAATATAITTPTHSPSKTTSTSDGPAAPRSPCPFFDFRSPAWRRSVVRRAAKVGRGLAGKKYSDKAGLLVVKHWLEAVDSKHRHGGNLAPYYCYWRDQSGTRAPFFQWLDEGGGKSLDLGSTTMDGKLVVPREELEREVIRYLTPEQRKHYEVVVRPDDGLLIYVEGGKLVHTESSTSAEKRSGYVVASSEEDESSPERAPAPAPETLEIDPRWIFVLSADGKLYVGLKRSRHPPRFQHSSFLSGGAAIAAGRLEVKDGKVLVVQAHSGHYRFSGERTDDFVAWLRRRGADLSAVRVEYHKKKASTKAV